MEQLSLGIVVELPEGSGPACVRLSGELDATGAEELLGRLRALLERAPEAGVVVDLSRLRLVDASGIRSFVELRALASERGVPVSLRAPRRSVRRVFDFVHLDEAVAIVDDIPA